MTNEYWHSRTNAVFDKLYKKRQIRSIYTKGYAEIEVQIKALYEQLQEVGELTTTQLYQYDRYRNLLKSIEHQQKNITKLMDVGVYTTLNKAYKETFGKTLKMMGSQNTWTVINPKMVEAAVKREWNGANFSRRIWNDTAKLANDIKGKVTNCLVTGTPKDTLVKEVMRSYGSGFAVSDRLVRTELSHTINTAQIDTYKQEGVKKVQWYASEDERMCDFCGDLHGKIFDIDQMGDDVEVIAHANCRCCLIPIIDNEKE